IRFWIDKGYAIVPISVNLSRIHIENPDIVSTICQIVDKYNVPRKFIEIELTESTDYNDMKKLIEVMRSIHNEGFLIAMDDFGKAYSSLNLLKEIPIDILKLDKDFLTSCSENSKGETIIELILSMSKKLGLEVVSEGVETKQQVDFLMDIGCNIAQGYYFAKPMPADEFQHTAFEKDENEVMRIEH
ncbi:MAG: EAL domain-containing protein, partial [Oscillospiraceae bacterium]